MRYFVHVTHRYEDEAKRHAQTKIIDAFINKVEKHSYFHDKKMDYASFPGNYCKKKHANFRTVFTYLERRVDGQDVGIYVALRMFNRGDKEYERFESQSTAENDRDRISGKIELDENQILEETRKRMSSSDTPVAMEQMSAGEEFFINYGNTVSQRIFDEAIYETKQWIDRLRTTSFPFANVGRDLSEYCLVWDDHYEGWQIIKVGSESDVIIAYKTFERLYLVDLAEKERFEEICSSYGENAEDELIKASRRAYPTSFTYDLDAWVSMVKDPNSNFILSDEELEIVSASQTFPLFISGRAGSGKSTVLQYLFAERLLSYLECREVGELHPPVYLSYSQNLIDSAIALSENLFKNNHSYKDALQKYNKKYDEDIKPLFDRTFYVFQEIIKECIREKNPGVLIERFSPEKYISFSGFKQLWEQKFGKNRIARKSFGPTLCWHIIRTYIKGWDNEDFLDPESYKEIGRSNKTVTDATYKMVFTEVWDKWYRDIDGWDDQDLVRYCLAPDDDSAETYVEDKASAVFCDESQDFTRVEIDFILRLSSFTNRIVEKQNIDKLPFVFAGDEFQTLNPTGFSWDSLKSYFAAQLRSTHGIDPKDISPNDPVPLTKNYRSTEQVVKLGNRFQLLREARFNMRSDPQDPYFAESGNSIFCLSPDDSNVWDRLKKMDVTLIIPSEEGQSPKDYIERSPIKDKISFYEDGTAEKLTILNPAQAKGLDYPNVAIYGFNCDEGYSDLSLDGLIRWFCENNKTDENEEADIDLKYQVSNAYVAVTRAKKKLFIIDHFNDKSFWAMTFAAEDEVMQAKVSNLEGKMIESLPEKRKRIWAPSKLGLIIEGSVNEVTDENIQNFSETIKALEERGKTICDAQIMRQAAARYRERGKDDDANRCQGWAYSFEERYLEAAECFIKSGEKIEAINNFWRELDRKPDKMILERVRGITGIVRSEVSFSVKSFLKDNTLRDIKVELDAFLKEAKNDTDRVLRCHSAWTFVITETLKTVSKKGILKSDIAVVLNQCRILNDDFHISINPSILADLAFAAEDYQKAIDQWEMTQPPYPKDYNIAKTKVLPYPENLEYLKSAGDPRWFDSVIEQFKKNGSDFSIDTKYRTIITDAAVAGKDFSALDPFLPNVLSTSTDRIEDLALLEKAKLAGKPFNEDVINTLLSIKYRDLDHWTRPSNSYKDVKAAVLFLVARHIKNSKLDVINRGLKEKKVLEYFSEKYQDVVRRDWSDILYVELGRIMESRGIFIDAIRFYEWAGGLAMQADVKRFLGARWIYCKEHQPGESSEARMQEVLNKRKDLGFTPEDDLPSEIGIKTWEKWFHDGFSVSNELRNAEPDQTKEASHDQSPDAAQGETITPVLTNSSSVPEINNTETPIDPISSSDAPRSTRIIKFSYDDYEFRYSCSKHQLTINLNNDNEDLRVRIADGTFPSGGDFVLNGNRMEKSDGGSTPFHISFDKYSIIVSVYDSDSPTGISFVFE